MGLGFQEILIIALIVLLLFGGKKIPELMKGLGKGVKSFKDGMKEGDEEMSSKEESSKEMSSKEESSKEESSKEESSKEVSSKEMSNKEVSSKEMSNKEVSSK